MCVALSLQCHTTHTQASAQSDREQKGDEGRPSGDFFPHVSPTLAEVVTMSGNVFSACFLSAFRSGHVRQTCPVPHTHVQLWLVSVPSARPPLYGATVPPSPCRQSFGFLWECAYMCVCVCVGVCGECAGQWYWLAWFLCRTNNCGGGGALNGWNRLVKSWFYGAYKGLASPPSRGRKWDKRDKRDERAILSIWKPRLAYGEESMCLCSLE